MTQVVDVTNLVKSNYTSVPQYEWETPIKQVAYTYTAPKDKYGIKTQTNYNSGLVELSNAMSLKCTMWFNAPTGFKTYQFRMFEHFAKTTYGDSLAFALAPNGEIYKDTYSHLVGYSDGYMGNVRVYCYDVADEVLPAATGYGAVVKSQKNLTTMSTSHTKDTLKIIDVIDIQMDYPLFDPYTPESISKKREIFRKTYNIPNTNVAFIIVSDPYYYHTGKVYTTANPNGITYPTRFASVKYTFTNNVLTIKEYDIDMAPNGYFFATMFTGSNRNLKILVVDVTNEAVPAKQYTMKPGDSW